MGIVNGTTNYILTRMTEEGVSYQDALSEAQSLGYAERDPTADVEGFDAGAKAAIIASIAFGARVVAGDVYHEGISGITEADIAFAKRLGYVVKLLAIVESVDGSIGVRVHPSMVPASHPLASVRESYNAVFVEGEAVGNLMFYGRGAGGKPTASAVLGDLIDAATNLRKNSSASVGTLVEARIRPIDEATSEYYLNLEVADRPGVLAAVAGIFGRHDVSIRAMEQEGLGDEARLIFITHTALRPTCKRRCTTCATSTSSTAWDASPGHLDDPLRQQRVVHPSSTSPMRSSKGSPETAASMCPMTLPKLPGELPASYVDVAKPDHGVDGDLVADAYATFDHDDVCPVVQLDDRLWVQELWHGPTLSFKDVALQLVGRLMDVELERRGERRTIVVATSGDTGSAAIAACVGRANLDIVVLHPAGRVSDVQRRQMTTVDEPNVHNLAVEGTFDDCQDLVKAMFADERFAPSCNSAR